MGFLKNLAEFIFATVAVTSLCTFLGGVLGIYPMVVLALGLNWAVGLVSASFASERVFDLTGASTYVICATSSLYLSTDELRKDVQMRPLVATALVCVWALRLGLFLFSRIVKDGHDSRFDAIRDRPLQFINIWSLQALWVLLTALPVFVTNSLPGQPHLCLQDVVGLSIWVIGFTIEVTADFQKTAFRNAAGNKGRWINSGLWAWSRHPNYFGEILLWCGMFILCSAGFTHWKHYIGIVSPFFVTFLLLFASGVPMLEAKADAVWGKDPAYVAYKHSTPTLVLWPPAKNKLKAI
mmetsp:Transcript_7098/g.12289  ORF Transcript_7098/g.12289 Transcript_7098/m.12289 type:complete len:295 (-) Transcript_7098:45-929(-)